MRKKLSNTDIGVVIFLLALGYDQHRIAALFDVNQGRISEINMRRRNLDEGEIPSITIQFPRQRMEDHD